MARDLTHLPALLEQAQEKLAAARKAIEERDVETASTALHSLSEHARWMHYVLEAARK